MKILKWFLSFEKEEKWLVLMARKGYFLKNVSSLGCYSFDVANPEERIYKIDCRVFNKNFDLRDYVTLFEDSGWNCAFSSIKSPLHYFYTNSPDVNNEIFSDAASKAQRQIRLAKYISSIYVACLLPYLVLFINGSLKFSNVVYLTPGLWDKKGLHFIFAFLFETPFVLFRSFGLIIPLIMMLIPIILYLRGKILYKKTSHI